MRPFQAFDRLFKGLQRLLRLQIVPDLQQSGDFDDGSDVVEHDACKQGGPHGGKKMQGQAAAGRADEDCLCNTKIFTGTEDILCLHRKLVPAFVRVPVRQSAPAIIQRDDAARALRMG